jgi:hypothetical protein
MTLRIPEDFPKSPPKGYFITKIFHPNISEKGDICVNTLKKDWDPMNWSIRHILKIIHCLLINPFPESALNEEAGKIFMDNYDQYFRRAKIFNDIHALPKGTAPAKTAHVKRPETLMDEVTQTLTQGEHPNGLKGKQRLRRPQPEAAARRRALKRQFKPDDLEERSNSAREAARFAARRPEEGSRDEQEEMEQDDLTNTLTNPTNTATRERMERPKWLIRANGVK